MIGTHIIVDIFGVSEEFFEEISRNYKKFDEYVEDRIRMNKMTLLDKSYKNFEKDNEYIGAFTSLYLLSESHISFHSWSEKRYIAMDVFTCGECDTKKLVNEILEYIKPEYTDIKILKRGSKFDIINEDKEYNKNYNNKLKNKDIII